MTPVHAELSRQRQQQVMTLLTKALQSRGPLLPGYEVNLQSIMVPLLTAVCFVASQRHVDSGFYYLREAITRLQIVRVKQTETSPSKSLGEQAQLERLYWLLFIHERFFSISFYRQAVLSVLPNFPAQDSCWSAGVQEGFMQIIRLFRAVDRDFLEHWLDRQKPSMTFEWIQSKQAELGDDIDSWEDQIKYLSVMQQVDLIVTCYWLRILVWQMALSKLLLTSNPGFEQEFMSVVFPVTLSSRLRGFLTTTPRQAVEVHGTGILQKIFDITTTLADVLEYVVGVTDRYEDESHNLSHFLFFVNFLVSMSNFDHVGRTVLENKLRKMTALFSPAQMSLDGAVWT